MAIEEVESPTQEGEDFVYDTEFEHYQAGTFRGAVMVAGSFGGAIVGLTPVIGYLLGMMSFEAAVLWQVGFIVMAVSMGLSGVMLRD